jgi:nitrite reductase (NADH) large subunit
MSKLREKLSGNREELVVVGAGMAAARLIEELIALNPERYSIRVIGDEPRSFYNRVLLSSVLANDVALDDVELKPMQWWRDAGVDVMGNCKAARVDAETRNIELESGDRVGYSKLVLATGSRAIRLPIEGADLNGVFTFRDVKDVEALAQLGSARQKVVVIGGGLLGLEAAYGLVRRGAVVTLVHVMDRLMERQLDESGGALLARLAEAKGVRIVLNANATKIVGEGNVRGLWFADGSMIDADAVVFAVGVRPNIDLARSAGIATNRGVIVDDCLATSAEDVFALGECVEHRGVCYGLVEPAYEQAKVLAAQLAGCAAAYSGSIVSTNLKDSGVRVFSAGDFLGDEGTQRIVYSDPRMGVYRKLVLKDDRLCGAILMGDVRDARSYLDLIRSGACVDSFRDDLMFGLPASLREAA